MESNEMDVAPVVDFLVRGHENLGRLLLVLDSHLSRVLSHEKPDERLMLAIVRCVDEYIEQQHNPVEELVLERLERRASWLHALFEAHRRELDALRCEMALFAGLLERGPAADASVATEIATAGHAVVAALRRRVAVEDAEFLPVASQVLDADDWRAVADALAARALPWPPPSAESFKTQFDAIVANAGCECEYE